MKRILAYKAKVGFLPGGHFWLRAKCERNWLGRVRLEFSGRKMESRLKPGIRMVFWPVFGEARGRLLGEGFLGGGATPVRPMFRLLVSPGRDWPSLSQNLMPWHSACGQP